MWRHRYLTSIKGKKIYRVKAIIPISPKKLIDAMMDTDHLIEWNTTLTKHEILKVNIDCKKDSISAKFYEQHVGQ